VAYRDCCGHWQVILKLFVMVIPKNDFSLFVVFSSRSGVARLRALRAQTRYLAPLTWLLSVIYSCHPVGLAHGHRVLLSDVSETNDRHPRP
jgi:hypothetical protein